MQLRNLVSIGNDHRIEVPRRARGLAFAGWLWSVPRPEAAAATQLGRCPRQVLPLALLSGEPYNEIEGLMAMVILDGHINSTALDLLTSPTLALRFRRFARKLELGAGDPVARPASWFSNVGAGMPEARHTPPVCHADVIFAS